MAYTKQIWENLPSTNTFIVPIEAGSDMTIFLYSSSSGVTFRADSYVQIYKIGEFNFN